MQPLSLMLLRLLNLTLITIWLGHAACSTAVAGVYRWVDENGVTHYGDHMPPHNGNTEKQKLNKSGDYLDPVKPEEPRKEDSVNPAEQRDQQKQERYDRYLLSTYENAAQIETARKEHLAVIDARIKYLEQGIAQEQAKLEQAQAAPGDNKQRIAVLQSRIRQDQNSRATLVRQRDETVRKFTQDIERYEFLQRQIKEKNPLRGEAENRETATQ